jgi:hypothetical protein
MAFGSKNACLVLKWQILVSSKGCDQLNFLAVDLVVQNQKWNKPVDI